MPILGFKWVFRALFRKKKFLGGGGGVNTDHVAKGHSEGAGGGGRITARGRV